MPATNQAVTRLLANKVHITNEGIAYLSCLIHKYFTEEKVNIAPSHPCFRFAGKQMQWLPIASC